MTMPVRNLKIAVIGDEDLVSGMRLGGISRYYTVNGESVDEKGIREAFTGLINEAEIGILMIQEDYLENVADLMARHRQRGAKSPLVVEVPAKHGTRYTDVGAYYRAYIKKSIGFDIEI